MGRPAAGKGLPALAKLAEGRVPRPRDLQRAANASTSALAARAERRTARHSFSNHSMRLQLPPLPFGNRTFRDPFVAANQFSNRADRTPC